MDSVIGWKILRVLTTNRCNYSCEFCHNEGQVKDVRSRYDLDYEVFHKIINALSNTSIKAIYFSGGEPFLNPDTIKMINYAHSNTDFEIGVATNAALLSESHIKELSYTRVRMNLQFPAIEALDFMKITQSGKIDRLYNQIILLKYYGIKFNLNHVMTHDNYKNIISVIDYAVKNSLSLKILPNINSEYSSEIFESIFSYLDSLTPTKMIKGTGAIKWVINDGGRKNIEIKFINSPCFTNNIRTCQEYAEIRLLPDNSLQTCIKNNSRLLMTNSSLSSDKEIRKYFEESWKTFTSC